ncbi:MAG: viologen exporter family transport system permease protein [Gaiellaceae bacterium]|nr:viologen exporter family transport system permease protein [Gaiellaceae bacterium]
MRPFVVAWTYLRLGVLNELQYRANFFVALFQSALQVGVGLAVLALVYSHTEKLNGWTESQLLIIVGIQILLGGIVHSLIQPNMERLTQEVQDGKLDFALTRPEDAQLIISVRQVQLWNLVEVVSGSIVVAVGVARLGRGVDAGHVLAFVGLLGVGALLLYCFWLLLATGAFWVVNMWFLSELFEGLYQTGRWPIGIYPGWLRYSMTYLVPVGFAVTVPAQAMTGRLSWMTVGIALLFAVALTAFTRWFWRFGLRRYSGASA